MRIRVLLFVGIILLMLGGCGFKGNKTGSAPTPTPTPEQDIISSQIPEIKIEAVYPAHMIINQSYVITVSLVSKTEPSPILQSLEKATMVVTEPTPVGTPGTTVQQAFGQGFKPVAIATLNAGSFKVLSALSGEQSPSGEQSLEQPVVEWDWNVTPQYTGTQILSVDITIRWDQTQSAVVLFVPKFRIGNPQLSVDVTEPQTPPPPFFTIGQINLANLIGGVSTLIGAGLVTLLVTWIQRRRKKKNKQASSTTPTTTPTTTPSSPPAKDVTDDKKTP